MHHVRITLVTVAVVLATLAATSTAAHARPEQGGAEPAAAAALAPSDGCTRAPDGIGRASFEDACAAHDACYESATSRLDCDDALKEDITAACHAGYDGIAERGLTGRALEANLEAASQCYGAAETYRAVVRARGESRYVGTGDRT